MLTIIAGLGKLAGLDITNPTTAAKKIVAALDGMGVSIGQRTVEDHLKRVDGALDRRSK